MYQHRRLNLHLPLDHVILTNSPVVDHQNSDDKKTTPLKIDAQKINTCLMKHKAHLAGGGFRERGGSGGWGGGGVGRLFLRDSTPCQTKGSPLRNIL